ncbi:flavin-dependent dehydrogenase [Mesorhizobium soli]|uniref:NAD(P)/FAD-dependent oxidoreductase n=1 Tax=Pseudaminobacter soli (ex Li et al. 2025) TaxID=1295366 RepID=UPI0024752F38|nr:FAD-dependent monooxygenase [Mesorhizobium soli]MDH6234807.1 flavin-dependent dehydrogenase [Mesorhizobium soli]
MTWAETVVIGGGPAGSAAACGLARSGRDVMLIERTAKPHHKVCGEFLSVETRMQLQRLGVDPLALGAVPIDHVAVHSSRRSVSSELPFRALSLSRYRLDDALLRCAQSTGARLNRNVTVKSVMQDASGWNVFCDNGNTIQCRHLVVATGKLGLRGIDDTRDGSMVGLKMHLRPSLEVHRALAGRVELFFLDGCYIGLELIEDGIANLCLVVPRATMARIGPGWHALHGHLASALPSLAERLAGAEPLWDKPMAVVCPAGGHLHREQKTAVFRVGDRLAHIPPFTGDGLAIALGTAALAVEHVRLGLSPEAYLAAARQLTASPIRLASVVSRLAMHRGGRNLMLGAAACAPGLIETIVRRTRLILAFDDS